MRFLYNEHACKFVAKMNHDWMDMGILNFLNDVLEKEKNPKKFYFMNDGNQICIVFYNTAAWAEKLIALTGHTLTTFME